MNEDDQGEYQCQINTEPRKTKRIFLTVQGKQTFSIYQGEDDDWFI